MCTLCKMKEELVTDNSQHSPLPTSELEQLAAHVRMSKPRHSKPNLTRTQACESVIGASETYDHSKVSDWNTSIIVRTRHPPFLLLKLTHHAAANHTQNPDRKDYQHQYCRRACATPVQIHHQQHRDPTHRRPVGT